MTDAKGADADILKDALECFARAESAESHNRTEFKEDIKFARLSQQWPENIEKARQREGRPCLTINKVSPVIRQVVNDARLNRPAITARPVDGEADKETAEIITGLIRNIEQSSDADTAYDTAIDNAVSGGFGYFRINLDFAQDIDPGADISSLGPESFMKDIVFERIVNPLSVYGDPHSTSPTSADWMRAFVIEDMPKRDFKKKYPKAIASDFSAGDWATEDTIRVAEYWKREKTERVVAAFAYPDGETLILDVKDAEKRAEELAQAGAEQTGTRSIPSYKVTRYLLTAAEVLESSDWLGTYIPIVPVYGDEVFSEGKRYLRSIIRDAKDANRMFNYWRTTSTELVALAPKAPFVGRKGAFETDRAKWATANTASHAHLEYDGPEMPQRQPFSGVPAGALQEAMNAADDIKATTGIYDASLGAPSNETSGKAITARQREGDVSSFHFIDNLSRSIRHAGRIILDLIPKIYSTPRMIRVLGEDGQADNTPINGIEAEQTSEDGDMRRVYDLRTGRYDLVVKSGPAFSTRREEAAMQMMELVRSFPDSAPVIGDLLAKNLDWPGSDEIAKRLERMVPPEARGEESGDPETQQQMQQMGQMLQELQGKLQAAETDKQLEHEKLEIERYKAETDRMASLQQAMTPEVVQSIVMQTLSDLTAPDLPQGEGQSMPTGYEPEQMELTA